MGGPSSPVFVRAPLRFVHVDRTDMESHDGQRGHNALGRLSAECVAHGIKGIRDEMPVSRPIEDLLGCHVDFDERIDSDGDRPQEAAEILFVEIRFGK